MTLPKVHIAVNYAGLATSVGSIAGFIVTHQSCVAAAVPSSDALALTAIAGAVAAFLPAKQNTNEGNGK